MKGCSTESKRIVAKYKDKFVFYKCPTNYYSGYAASLITHAMNFDKGVLPYTGGLLDQPSKIVEAINQIQALIIEDQNNRAKEQARKWQTTNSRSRLRQTPRG
jgi:hypothetical protein